MSQLNYWLIRFLEAMIGSQRDLVNWDKGYSVQMSQLFENQLLSMVFKEGRGQLTFIESVIDPISFEELYMEIFENFYQEPVMKDRDKNQLNKYVGQQNYQVIWMELKLILGCIFYKLVLQFYQDIMNSGGLRRGLHIDDDDEPQKYEYGGFAADKKRGNFEKDLDAMLFGGFGAPPPRRRPASENKPAEQVKSAEQPKPVQNSKVQPSNVSNVTKPTTNTTTQPNNNPPPQQIAQTTGKQTLPVNNVVNQLANTIKAPQTDNNRGKSVESALITISQAITTKVTPQVKPNVKPIENNTTVNQNKSTESSKNANQTANNPTITINSNAKVVVNPTAKPIITNHKKQASIIVPYNQNDKTPAINNIPIESQPILPEKKIDNYVQPAKQPQKSQQKKNQPIVPTPTQPPKYEQPLIIDVLHPFTAKNLFNKPAAVRKLKKAAEDFKFAEENITLHSAIDVVRPSQTDRSKQRKLNDVNFNDYEFPNNSISLGGDHKDKPSVWKRQNELAKNATFGKYIDPNDINPGILSSPHFVSILSSIAESQVNTKRLIEDQKSNPNGFYLIRLFVNSVWRYIVVDSTLPFIDNQHAGVVSNPDSQFELSGALIEKAYAKVFGGYDNFSRVQSRSHCLRDLTGAPVKKYSIQNPDLSSIIKKALGSGQIVVAVPNEKVASVGLNPNYSYSLLNYSAKGSMELRNSFGTLQEKSKISLKPEGTFDLGASQVKDFISHILITNLNSSYSTTTIQSRHKAGFYSSYNFKVRKDTHGFLTVSQWDERLFPKNSGYQYSPFHLVLHRIEQDGNATFISAGFTAGSRNLDLEVNLTPGDYTVFVSANWKHTDYAYNLTFYGAQRVDFQRVYTEKLPNLISQSLQKINVEQGRRSETGKSSAQYFLYHQESNLAVITVQNTGDRDNTVTADLSKVKFDQLILLTSHNNEENYSNKIASQIDEYKQIPLTDRKWSVTLPPHHRFTWVLASSLPFDEKNPQKWGFK